MSPKKREEEERSLTVGQPQALTKWDDPTSWDLPSDTEVLPTRLPILKICQPVTREKPNGTVPGQMFITLTGEVFESVNVLILDIKLNKSMWPPFNPSNPKPEPICCSDDGIVPSTRGLDPQPGPCRARVRSKTGKLMMEPYCPYAKWTDDEKTGGRKPPECPDNFGVLLWLIDYGYPVLMMTKRKGEKSLAQARQILDMAQMAVPAGGMPSRLTLAFEMSTKDEKTYHIPSFRVRREIQVDPAVSMELKKRFGELRIMAAMMTAEEMAGAEVSTDGAPEGDPYTEENGDKSVPF